MLNTLSTVEPIATTVLNSLLNPLSCAQILTSLFLAILFLQSGLDKVFNFSDNLSWLRGHFAKTPFRSQVKMMLITITMAEVAAGALALLGAAQIALNGVVIARMGVNSLALYGAQLAALDIVLLFFGQRIAKDYVGAAALVPYFIVCIGDVLLLSLSLS